VLRPLAVVSPAPRPKRTPTPRPAIATRFARPYFDAGRQAIVWPYLGAAPGYRLAPPTAGGLTVEIPHAALQTPGRIDRALSGHPLLTRFEAVEAQAQGTLSLRLGLARPGDAVVALDPARRQLLVFPQAAGAPGEAAPVRTVFGRVGVDPQAGAIVLRYFGQAPTYTVEPVSPTHVAVDFLGAAIEPAGVQFEAVRDMPLLSFWLAAPRPAHTVRLALVMRYPGTVRVQDDAASHRLLVLPVPGPAPSP
jgi:hypothetical protein